MGVRTLTEVSLDVQLEYLRVNNCVVTHEDIELGRHLAIGVLVVRFHRYFIPTDSFIFLRKTASEQ